MDDLKWLLKRKEELGKQILQGKQGLYAEYNEVCLKIAKIQHPIRFRWPGKDNGENKSRP